MKKWSPLSAILVSVGIYFGSQVLAAVFLGLFASLRSYDAGGFEQLLKTSEAWQFSFFALFHALSLAGLWAFLRRAGISWADLGLKRPKLSDIARAIPVFVGYFLLLISVMFVLSQAVTSINVDQKQQLGFNDAASGFGPLVLIFLALVVFTPIVEEILVRGFLYGGLRNHMPKLRAALITSLLFGFAHLQLGGNAPPLWVAAIDTFILSMFLIWLREKTGNLWAGITVHMLKNGLAFASLYLFHVS